MDNSRQAGPDRSGAAALLGAAAGTLFAMAHHPTSAHASQNGMVHAALILLVGLLAFGFARLALRLEPTRAPVLAGSIAYAIAVFAGVGAATINGFVVPALAARGEPIGRDILNFAWETNQALAWLGVFATATAYLLWSVALARIGRTGQLLAAIGMLAGAVPATLLAAGLIRMDVTGAFIAYASQVGWAALVGLWLLRPMPTSAAGAA